MTSTRCFNRQFNTFIIKLGENIDEEYTRIRNITGSNSRVYRAIRRTIKRLRKNGYLLKEAKIVAWKKRRHLIKQIMEENSDEINDMHKDFVPANREIEDAGVADEEDDDDDDFA